jgi:predicted lipid-binding transport protein (Tim44 family)
MAAEQASLEKCWFCAAGVADEEASAQVRMHKMADKKDLVITLVKDTGWVSTTVHIPRCPKCKAAHDRTETHVQKGALVGLAVGLPLGVLSFVFVGGILTLIAFVVVSVIIGGMVGWAVGREVAPEGVRDQDLATSHPTVRRMQEVGWKVGNQPAG